MTWESNDREEGVWFGWGSEPQKVVAEKAGSLKGKLRGSYGIRSGVAKIGELRPKC